MRLSPTQKAYLVGLHRDSKSPHAKFGWPMHHGNKIVYEALLRRGLVHKGERDPNLGYYPLSITPEGVAKAEALLAGGYILPRHY